MAHQQFILFQLPFGFYPRLSYYECNKYIVFVMQLSQKPKSLFCYACGRQFGTTSLSIHLKSCLKKYQIEQSKKQPKDRRKLPDPPEELDLILNGNLDHDLIQVYNKKASNTHKYEVLPKCRFCSRTFNQQSLKAHQNGCSKKGNQKVQQKPSYNLPDNLKKPRTLTCCVCGREFGLTSLKIHYPQCLQKFRDDQKKKLKQDRRQPPQFSQQQIDIINNKQDWTLQEIQAFNNKANESYKEKSMVQCPNCGRRFLEASYLKHKKNCVMLNGDKNSSSVSKSSQSTPKANFRQTTSEFKKPRTLTCCVCGRDFGLTSLKIHYPQCLEKFKTDQLKKPKNQRRVPPQFSQEQLETINNKQDWTMQQVDEFNSISSGHYRDKAMVQCQNCGRKFLQESYLKHKKNCALINGKKNNVPQQNRNVSNDAKLRPTSSQYKKPRTLTCCVCGREFGLTSLKIHYPQCLQKFHNDEKKKPKEERKAPPEFGQQELQMINNKENWTSEQIQQFNSKANNDYRSKAMVQCPNCGRKFLQASYLKHKKNCVLINGANPKTQSDVEQSKKQSGTQLKKPKVLMCFICGRQFGLTSLTIHLPKCKQKFQNLEKKKEKEQRRPVPQFPEDLRQKFNLQNAIDWQIEKIQQYNKVANEIYRAQSLCACPICGRKFFEESLVKHIKFCEKNKEKQAATDQKAKLNETKSKSLSKQSGLNKKLSYLLDKSEQIKKIQQETQEQLLNSSPQDPKKMDNESFLRKSFYQKLKNSSENKKIENNISQVDQSMEDTLKETNKSIKPFKILQNQQVLQESVKKEQESINKQQIENSSQKKSQKLLEKIKQKKSKQSTTPIRQSRLMESQIRQEKNNSQIKQSAKKLKQVNNKPQLNKSVAMQSIKNRPESRYKETKTNSRPASRKSQSNISMQMSKKNQKKQMNESKVLQNTHKLQDIVVDLPVKEKEEGKNKQIPREILSPMEKARQSKGFAAPRKKEETNLANMKECKICKRKFDQERIEKHQKSCAQNQEKQKKSEKIIKNAEQMNQSIRLKTSEKTEEPHKQQINERDVLSPQQKIRLKKGFAAPRQKQSQIQSLMAECRGCKRKFTSDRIQKHEGICKQAQQSLKQPFTAGTYKKIQQSATIEGEKLSIKRVGCPKCHRKFAEQRLEKHVQICKAIPTEMNQQKLGNGNVKTQKKPLNGIKQTSYAIDEAAIQAQKQASQNMNLQLCQKCGRKFLAERMDKHSQVCKGTNSLSVQPNSKKDALKKQKQLPPTKQYNLQKLQIKQESQVDTRVECPRCCRKFLPDRLDKHLNACKSVPPLSNIQSKTKMPKEIHQPKQQKPNMKISMVQSPKEEQKQINTIGDDQYVQTQLEPCPKCCRKFVPDRLRKHIQICKGNKPKTEIEKKGRKTNDSNTKKINDEELKKTKNEFFNMVKDLKNKKVKEEDVEKQLDGELQQIQETIRVHRKQNINRENSDKKRAKQSMNKSINLPKI